MSGSFFGSYGDLAYAYFEWMGGYFQAEIAFNVTEWGSPPIVDYVNGGDPGIDPEWEIEAIVLREDRADGLGPEFKTTGKLFQLLCQDDRINDAILEEVSEANNERRWSQRYRRVA